MSDSASSRSGDNISSPQTARIERDNVLGVDSAPFSDDLSDEEQVSTISRSAAAREKAKRSIQSEVDLAASLDKLEDDDLAIHLYNVHSLKSQCYHSGATQIKLWHGKRRWTSADQKAEWTPKPSWTAWPLEPHRVPDQEERFFADLQEASRQEWRVGTSSPNNRTKPSQPLEDCLLGEILRQARLKFRERLEKAQSDEPTSKRRKLDDGGSANRELGSSAGQKHDPRKRIGLLDTLYLPHPLGSVKGQSHRKPHRILADEPQARHRAQPVIRHIISQLEMLLNALHKSRSNHQRQEGSDSEGQTSSGTESSGTSRCPSARPKRLKVQPRDWSEILGAASFIGWDADSVSRAAVRCSALFGETMNFKRLSEGRPEYLIHGDAQVVEGEQLMEDIASQVHLDSMTCPHLNCPRNRLPYASRWRLNEHLKRTHGYGIPLRAQRTARTSDEQYGCVHVDGFLRKIKASAHWKKPRNYTRRRVSQSKSDASSSRERLSNPDEVDSDMSTASSSNDIEQSRRKQPTRTRSRTSSASSSTDPERSDEAVDERVFHEKQSSSGESLSAVDSSEESLEDSSGEDSRDGGSRQGHTESDAESESTVEDDMSTASK